MAKRSAETRAKISKARREMELERLAAEDHRAVTQKRCPRCEEIKPVAAFSYRKSRLKCGLVKVYPEPRCRECRRQERRTVEARKRAEGIDIAAEQRERYKRLSKQSKQQRLRRGREWMAAKRREEGIEPRKFTNRKIGESHRLPVEPIAEFLEGRSEDRTQLSEVTGVHERRLLGIERRECATVTLPMVDKILVGLGCMEEMNNLYPTDDDLVGYGVLDPKGLLKR